MPVRKDAPDKAGPAAIPPEKEPAEKDGSSESSESGSAPPSVAAALRDALSQRADTGSGTEAPSGRVREPRGKKGRSAPGPVSKGERVERLIRNLGALWGKRRSLRVQFAAGLGTAVAFPLLAGVVALFAFFRVSTLQREINLEHVPALTRAAQIGQLAAHLAGAAPRLVAEAQNRGVELHEGDPSDPVHFDVGDDLMESAARIIELSSGMTVSSRTEGLQAFSADLAGNLRDIQASVNASTDLQDRLDAIRRQAVELNQQLNQAVGPPLDDQLFFMATGLRELDDTPAPLAIRSSEAEVMQMEALAVIDSRGNLALSLLNDATVLEDFARLDTVEEQFQAASDGAGRAISTLGTRAPPGLAAILAELRDLGLAEEGAFTLRRAYLTEIRNQLSYLERNVSITNSLEETVTAMTIGLEVDALTATEGSERALNLGRLLLVVLNVIGIGCAGLILWLFVGPVLIARLTHLSSAMRRMAEGDLESEIRTRGSDEVAEMGQALEVFRRHALEVQRLNLVEQLATRVEAQNEELAKTLDDLRRAQDQMVMQEKLASLGQLTAGIAHEIKNPLNFVNNFADISVTLIEDLNEEIELCKESLPEDSREEIEEISEDLSGNMKRIVHHGQRASSIVYGMLEHARKEGGTSRPTDINQMLEEFIALAFHSMRAEDNTFQMTIHKDFGQNVGEIEAVPQDLSRVFLNIVTNACQATLQKQHAADVEPGYEPSLRVRSRRDNGIVEVRIRDNGPGIPTEIRNRIFEPFFTTKEGTKGTGLGLSLSHDIVRSHGGTLAVNSEVGRGAEFVVTLPVETPKLPGGTAGSQA